MAQNEQLRKGSTFVLILSMLENEPMYGYRISRELESQSKGYFTMKEGLLYPALHKMEDKGLLTSQWRDAGSRRRKYYRITSRGRKHLNQASSDWRVFTSNLIKMIGKR